MGQLEQCETCGRTQMNQRRDGIAIRLPPPGNTLTHTNTHTQGTRNTAWGWLTWRLPVDWQQQCKVSFVAAAHLHWNWKLTAGPKTSGSRPSQRRAHKVSGRRFWRRPFTESATRRIRQLPLPADWPLALAAFSVPSKPRTRRRRSPTRHSLLLLSFYSALRPSVSLSLPPPFSLTRTFGHFFHPPPPRLMTAPLIGPLIGDVTWPPSSNPPATRWMAHFCAGRRGCRENKKKTFESRVNRVAAAMWRVLIFFHPARPGRPSHSRTARLPNGAAGWTRPGGPRGGRGGVGGTQPSSIELFENPEKLDLHANLNEWTFI